ADLSRARLCFRPSVPEWMSLLRRGSQYANIAVWVISRKRLKEFWERHPQAEVPLRAWFQVASRAEWQHLVDVRRDFPHADAVGPWTVFNVGGNDFRLV